MTEEVIDDVRSAVFRRGAPRPLRAPRETRREASPGRSSPPAARFNEPAAGPQVLGKIGFVLVQVEAEPDDRVSQLKAGQAAFAENAAELFPFPDDVVRPAQLGRNAGRPFHGFAGGQAGGQREKRKGSVHLRTENHGDVEPERRGAKTSSGPWSPARRSAPRRRSTVPSGAPSRARSLASSLVETHVARRWIA